MSNIVEHAVFTPFDGCIQVMAQEVVGEANLRNGFSKVKGLEFSDSYMGDNVNIFAFSSKGEVLSGHINIPHWMLERICVEFLSQRRYVVGRKLFEITIDASWVDPGDELHKALESLSLSDHTYQSEVSFLSGDDIMNGKDVSIFVDLSSDNRDALHDAIITTKQIMEAFGMTDITVKVKS